MRDENNKLDDKAEYTLGDVKRKAEKQQCGAQQGRQRLHDVALIWQLLPKGLLLLLPVMKMMRIG